MHGFWAFFLRFPCVFRHCRWPGQNNGNLCRFGRIGLCCCKLSLGSRRFYQSIYLSVVDNCHCCWPGEIEGNRCQCVRIAYLVVDSPSEAGFSTDLSVGLSVVDFCHCTCTAPHSSFPCVSRHCHCYCHCRWPGQNIGNWWRFVRLDYLVVDFIKDSGVSIYLLLWWM